MKSLLLTFLFLIYFSVHADIVVNEHGEISEELNQLKAKIQGEAFWRNQLEQANLELARHLESAQKKKKFDAKISAIEARFQDRTEELYRKYPNMRPTLAEQQANALRAQADDIESRDLDAELEQRRLKRISVLRSIIKYIESR